ncbi:MAG: 4Fe-4S binding protein [Provencibacterium sp.]|jgi:iron only hydrogenase large subunit-like protein|nr:4Fe-4S binding protein [Provencibacterium sp.]
MAEYFHSVTLDRDACKGCTHCVKRCPTEAIRVRDGKAKIIKERCIDCGECIRICPHHAKQAIFDPLESMESFPYRIALPAPALYGQFNNLDDVDILLEALHMLGFNEVFEVARAAEIVSDSTRRLMSSGMLQRPVISSACPAVLRLIRVRFPELIPNILPLRAPIEVAARMAKKEAVERTGRTPEEIGVFFISPCPAKVTAVKRPLGSKQSAVDGVLAIRDVYPKLIRLMKEVSVTAEQSSAGRMGMGWGSSGGEAAALLNDRYLAADGIENVIKVLEDLEDDKFTDLDFVELNACSAGCVGGVLNVENPYVAKAKLKRIRKYRPVSCNHIEDEVPRAVKYDSVIDYEPVMELDSNLSAAMEKMRRMQELEDSLPGLDCGSCGAPTCRALAEDIVRGFAAADDCIFRIKENLATLAEDAARRDAANEKEGVK